MKLSIKDSRGKESITLSFVFASWASITGVFLWKGDAGDIAGYAAGCAAILAIWFGREWTEKRKTDA